MNVGAAAAQISAPTEIANLVFWVDAQDVTGTGVQPAGGSVVSTWVDKSGGGNDLTTAAGVVTFEETGFDGLAPGLRFPLTARMAAPNPFSGPVQNEITVFFVNANVTLTNNFSLSLNGTNQGTNIADGRFSFHTPWTNNRVYFDAGACCGSTRLQGVNPNGLTETTLYTGVNDAPGNRQLLRIDGTAFSSDTTGHDANVSRGVHLGDLPSAQKYNGRFAEVVVYERALSLSEIEDIECYLLLKWKPTAAPSTCDALVTATKSVTPYETAGPDSYDLPGTDVVYTIEVTHNGGADIDLDTMLLIDKLPSEIEFYNGDIDDGGAELNPVSFIDNSSGLSLVYADDIAFSDLIAAPSDFASCNYSPTIGYDPDVTYVCINPSGVFSWSSPTSSFSISFRGRIK